MSTGVSGGRARAKPKGRPAGLERIPPKVRASILERIRFGAPGSTAAVSCGVAERTFVRWLELGRAVEAREPYRAFARQVDEAFAEWKVGKVREIDLAGAKDWRASMELLKRRAPEDFTDPDRAGTTVTTNIVLVQERDQAASELLAAARRVLADMPEKLLELEAEIAGPDVIDGDAVDAPDVAA